MGHTSVVATLREAGCVFAEEEARILLEAASAGEATSSGTAVSVEETALAASDASDAVPSTMAERDDTLTALLARRVDGEPLEQIVGWVEFAGSRLNVAPGVFVPRQRTALLAHQSILAVRAAQDTATPARSTVYSAAGDGVRFLEAFCGVGPVAATVGRAVPGTRIHLGDHDEAALKCARKNAGPDANYHRLSCLAGLPQALRGGLDVIAAVPPYVPVSAAEFLPREALEHEAPTALFGGVDGLDLVRSLIRESGEWVAPSGVVLIELGMEQQHTASEFASALGFAARSIFGDDEQTLVLELRLNT